MKKIYTSQFQSPFGLLLLGTFEDQLCLCDWSFRKSRNSIDSRIQKALKATMIAKKTSLAEEAERQLNAYFEGNLQDFKLPLLPLGTAFQKTVWTHLQEIPYGQTYSYQQLSEKMGHPETIRAIASANGANALAILIPCHRIIGTDGSMVGYAGGLDAKKKLLRLEGVRIQKDRTQLTIFST